jgi:hypothetical protein
MHKPPPGSLQRPPSHPPFEVTPVPVEVIEEALLDINEEEIAADVREIYRTGGFALCDFWSDLEQAAERHE